MRAIRLWKMCSNGQVPVIACCKVLMISVEADMHGERLADLVCVIEPPEVPPHNEGDGV